MSKPTYDKIRDVLLEARDALWVAHQNWSDVAHDSTSTCKLCRAIQSIDALMVDISEPALDNLQGKL